MCCVKTNIQQKIMKPRRKGQFEMIRANSVLLIFCILFFFYCQLIIAHKAKQQTSDHTQKEILANKMSFTHNIYLYTYFWYLSRRYSFFYIWVCDFDSLCVGFVCFCWSYYFKVLSSKPMEWVFFIGSLLNSFWFIWHLLPPSWCRWIMLISITIQKTFKKKVSQIMKT